MGPEKHSFDTMTWYRYVKSTMGWSDETEGCYVCSKLPPSSTQTHLAAKWRNKTEAKCMASMAGIGFQHSNIVINN